MLFTFVEALFIPILCLWHDKFVPKYENPYPFIFMLSLFSFSQIWQGNIKYLLLFLYLYNFTPLDI